MHVLFVGGPWHGQAQHIPDDQDTVHLALLPPENTRHLYQKHRWQGVDMAHGFDSVFIATTVDPSEYEAKIAEALKTSKTKA